MSPLGASQYAEKRLNIWQLYVCLLYVYNFAFMPVHAKYGQTVYFAYAQLDFQHAVSHTLHCWCGLYEESNASLSKLVEQIV